MKSKLEDRERQLGEQRELLSRMDKDHDIYLNDLDEKAELITDLNMRLTNLTTDLRNVELDRSHLKDQIESLTHHLNNKDRENETMIRQIDELQRLKAQYQSTSQKFQEEATSLGTDLAALTRENQLLHAESRKVTADRDRFSSEIRECERQLQYLDQLIRNKDEENQKLMQSYRKVISDYEKLEINLATNNEDLKNTR